MSDLFAEIYEERAAIYEHDAGIDRATAEKLAAASTERYRHACEVRSVAAKYQTEGGEAVKAFLAQVAKHRGQPAADRLRADALREIGK